MANILDLAVGDYLTARVFSYHNSNRSREFVNTHEFRVNAIGVQSADLEGLANNLAAFHAALLITQATVDRVVISTYEAEEGGYDPYSFITVNTNQPGERNPGGDFLPANVVLYLKRQVAVGRSGKLHLRLALTESDIVAPAGVAQLAAPGVLNAEVAAAIAATGVDTYLAGLGGPGMFQMVMLAEYGVPPVLGNRLVQDLVPSGVRVTNPNHRYFDVP